MRAQQTGQVLGHVGLPPVGEGEVEDLRVGGVGGGPRRGKALQLPLVLHRAEHGQAVGERRVGAVRQFPL